MIVTISKRQAKEADMIGGLDLAIPWPDELGQPPDLPGLVRAGERVEVSAAARRVGESMVAAACEQHGLVPVHVRASLLLRPNSLPLPGTRVHLVVTLIGRRWVHASTKRRPRFAFAQWSE